MFEHWCGATERSPRKHSLHFGGSGQEPLGASVPLTAMRWFFVFLLVLVAWGGFVQVALKDDLSWKMWSGPDTPVS